MKEYYEMLFGSSFIMFQRSFIMAPNPLATRKAISDSSGLI